MATSSPTFRALPPADRLVATRQLDIPDASRMVQAHRYESGALVLNATTFRGPRLGSSVTMDADEAMRLFAFLAETMPAATSTGRAA